MNQLTNKINISQIHTKLTLYGDNKINNYMRDDTGSDDNSLLDYVLVNSRMVGRLDVHAYGDIRSFLVVTKVGVKGRCDTRRMVSESKR